MIYFRIKQNKTQLWIIECELEKLLPEPFMPNYDELVEESRKRLRDHNSE